MNPIPPNPSFGYSLALSQVMVDFMTEYRLQEGAVFERHGLIIGPEGAWTRANEGTIEILKIQVRIAVNLPDDVKALALRLLDSASHSMVPLDAPQ
jgi:hypothetical protein